MTTVVDLLRSAKQLISDPNHWTTGAFGRNAYNEIVSRLCEATRFCAVGALMYAQLKLTDPYDDYHYAYSLLTDAILNLRPAMMRSGSIIVHFNDNATHDEVMRVFDIAIDNAIAAACPSEA